MALRSSDLKGLKIPGLTERLIATLYADDTTVYLHADDRYDTLSGILDRWCRAARAKFNTTKTEVIPFGPMEYRNNMATKRCAPDTSLVLPADVKVVSDGESVRILGARIGNAVDRSLAWQGILRTVRLNFERWGRRNLSLHGRKLIVGLEIGSRTQYLAMAQGMPKGVEDELMKLTSQFMWNGMGRPLVGMSTLTRPIAQGGLGLLDLRARNQAIAIMWTKTYLDLTASRPKWAILADVLLARSPMATAKRVPLDVRVNPFLQSWDSSLHPSSPLPPSLKVMIRVAKRFGIRLDPLLPDEHLCLSVPIWYH
ncbi:hypothetical protein C2E23DRAFT_726691, partial [Lenzites betulinus]